MLASASGNCKLIIVLLIGFRLDKAYDLNSGVGWLSQGAGCLQWLSFCQAFRIKHETPSICLLLVCLSCLIPSTCGYQQSKQKFLGKGKMHSEANQINRKYLLPV